MTNFVWITQKEGNRNNNVIQKLIDKFVKAIYKEVNEEQVCNTVAHRQIHQDNLEGDRKNSNAIQLSTDEFVKRIQSIGMNNRKITL